MEKNNKKIIVVGAGPAGITSAIYARRYGVDVTVFEKLYEGGQVTTTPEVENYPAVPKVDGFTLANLMKTQAVELGTEFINEEVTGLALKGQVKTVSVGDKTYECDAVILATGASRRKLDVKGEAKFTGRGVSYCATCDGSFFKDKVTAVVGGGNTSLEDAIFLAGVCSKVYIIHRRDEFRAMPYLTNIVEKTENIEILYDAIVEEICGDKKVDTIKVKSVKTNEITDVAIDGVFVAVGTLPDNSLYKDYLNLDEFGYVDAGEDCKTNIEGVYIAGDCRKKPLRQIVTATSDGAVASFEATTYIRSLF